MAVRVARAAGGLLARRVGRVSGRDHRFERLALVLDIALGHFDQVRNQVVPPLQLHVDLREGILEAVPQGDQPVVHPDNRKHHHQHNHHQHDQNDQKRATMGTVPFFLLDSPAGEVAEGDSPHRHPLHCPIA